MATDTFTHDAAGHAKNESEQVPGLMPPVTLNGRHTDGNCTHVAATIDKTANLVNNAFRVSNNRFEQMSQVTQRERHDIGWTSESVAQLAQGIPRAGRNGQSHREDDISWPSAERIIGLSNEELRGIDPVVLNLVVAKGIPSQAHLDIARSGCGVDTNWNWYEYGN